MDLERVDELKKAMQTGCCPLCEEELEFTSSRHERDSSYDRYKCLKCDFRYTEMETWFI